MAPKGQSTAKSAAPTEIDPKALEALGNRLLAFARRYASLMTWWLGNADALAKGYAVEDVVGKALVSLYGDVATVGKRKRSWDREKYPDPWVYLVLFVKTELHNLSVSSENKLCDRDLDDDSVLTQDTPEALLLLAEADVGRANRVAQVYSLLVDEISDHDELQKLHDLTVNEGIRKPTILAKRLSISVTDVNNLKKRLSRAYAKIAARIEEGSDE